MSSSRCRGSCFHNASSETPAALLRQQSHAWLSLVLLTPARVCCASPPAPGVKAGDRVLLPDYGGQAVKLQDTECVVLGTCLRDSHWEGRDSPPCVCVPWAPRFMLYRDEEILGLLHD